MFTRRANAYSSFGSVV